MCCEDIVEIINVINLYSVAVDTRRWDLFDRVFTEDAHTDFGGPATWNDLVSLKQAFEIIHRPFEATLHVTTNHQVVVNDDRANCLSYVHGRFIREVSHSRSMFESLGWYDDLPVRSPLGWRIKKSACQSRATCASLL
jgi:hypothetical protein